MKNVLYYYIYVPVRKDIYIEQNSFRKGAVTMAKKSNTGIPGLSVNFSWKRALGITSAKQKFARKTGIPTTKAGLERKIGRTVLDLLNPKK